MAKTGRAAGGRRGKIRDGGADGGCRCRGDPGGGQGGPGARMSQKGQAHRPEEPCGPAQQLPEPAGQPQRPLSYTLPSETLNGPRCPEFSFAGPGERPGSWPEGHPVPERAWTLPSLPGPRMACATLHGPGTSQALLSTWGTLGRLSANACPVPGPGHLCRERADTAPAPRDRDAHETVGAQGGDPTQPRQSGEISRATGSSDRGESSQQK